MSGHVKNAQKQKRGGTHSKPDNPEQFKRFIDMAREVEADENPDAVDRAFNKIFRPKQKPMQSNDP
jgi:hypothetical protein